MITKIRYNHIKHYDNDNDENDNDNWDNNNNYKKQDNNNNIFNNYDNIVTYVNTLLKLFKGSDK